MVMFGIEKDFQKLMEQVYGPLNKNKMTEEPDTINLKNYIGKKVTVFFRNLKKVEGYITYDREYRDYPYGFNDRRYTKDGKILIDNQFDWDIMKILTEQQPVQYETPMTENEEEIEKVKAEIKMLQSKLSFLEELERTKSPVEEAYKKVYGKYPVKEVSENLTSEDNWNVVSWSAFQKGYEQSQKDYKVGEHQEPEPEKEPEELKTLFQMFYNRVWIESYCDEFCNIVKEWMSQYTHNVMSGEYLEGYNGCLDVLKENLK
jgi:hypothetical protein